MGFDPVTVGLFTSLIGPLVGGLFGGKEKGPGAPEKIDRPDETSEGIAEARQRRRSLASRTGRSGLKTPDIGPGQTRGGLTIVT